MANRSNGNGTVSRARRQGIFWLLTIPYPCSVMQQLLESSQLPTSVVWIRGQLEQGEQTDYLHYQAVAAFDTKKSLAAVKGVFGTCHAELSRSEAAEAYVHKQDTRVGEPFEFGAKPIRRNSRTDWESVWTAAKSGDLSSVPANIRVVSYHALRAIHSDHAVPGFIDRSVTVYYGCTGSGKYLN